MKLSISLKLMSVMYGWYLVVFIWSVMPLLNIPIGLVPEFRGDVYVWDFELFFTSIAVVWAFFLWCVSYNPKDNKMFIRFTIYATLAHMLAMMVVGVLRPGDMFHLARDMSAFVIPVSLLIYGYRSELID